RDGAWARIVVDEGPRAVFQKITVSGWPQYAKRDELEGAVVGEPFSQRKVEQARASMLRMLGRAGHLYADVEPSWSVDEKEQVTLAFRVSAGSLVRVGNIVLR